MNQGRVLIVEDQPDMAALVRSYLTRRGYETHVAGTGREAIAFCDATPPDIVLLDVRLPDTDGFSVGMALRNNPLTRPIPIVFVTARQDLPSRLRALAEVGAQYYLIKPFDVEELHAIIRKQLADIRQLRHSRPPTGLATAREVRRRLEEVLAREAWAVALAHVNNLDAFVQTYGTVAGEEVLRATGRLLVDVAGTAGELPVYAGQLITGPDFLIIADPDRLQAIAYRLATTFDATIATHYTFGSRELGFLEVSDEHGGTRQAPLMSLAIGVVRSTDGPFDGVQALDGALDAARHRAAALADHGPRRSAVFYGRPGSD